MQIITTIQKGVSEAAHSIFGIELSPDLVHINDTKKEFEGDFTVVVFSLLKLLKGNPEQIGNQIGEFLTENVEEVDSFNVVKGFLNLSLTDNYWINFLNSIDKNYWNLPSKSNKVVLEYCGPNTNKPLHLGHIRNMLVGWSLAEILQKAGNEVHKVNIYNDRGIAICKSMVAWKTFGNGETPETSGIKGDHLVGKYYVKYAQVEKEQALPFLEKGMEARDAAKATAIFKEAQETLLKWEQGDSEVHSLWETMNSWVYKGFNKTYIDLGVDFEKDYLESKTYLIGKSMVSEGLKSNRFFKKDDESVWVDLEDRGLDQKLLLRGDGTSVYITQDIGTAQLRYDDYKMDESIYVVGNEQDYHFKVLKEILLKMEKPYAEGIHHLSYGMVDLPTGKMKSREGTVVDADELMHEMFETAKATTEELGKIDDFSQEEREQLYRVIGLGALKFFILKVNPKKRMLFDPKESIDFQGFTGPFVQYTHARIKSMLDKSGQQIEKFSAINIKPNEAELLKLLHAYQNIVDDSAKNNDPSQIANYVYNLAKTFNKFYAGPPILTETDKEVKAYKLYLSKITAEAIKQSLGLLGIKAPNRM